MRQLRAAAATRRHRRSRSTSPSGWSQKTSASSCFSPTWRLTGCCRDDPERAWQLMRRHGARRARLDQRRLARDALRTRHPRRARSLGGDRAARLLGQRMGAPHGRRDDRDDCRSRCRASERAELQRSPALDLVRPLIGRRARPVRKALSWALRSWREVDPRGVDELLAARHAARRETNDGNRAWVIRDAMKEQRTPVPQPSQAENSRACSPACVARPGNQSTSEAAQIAGRFVGLESLSDDAVRLQGQRQRMAVVGSRYQERLKADDRRGRARTAHPHRGRAADALPRLRDERHRQPRPARRPRRPQAGPSPDPVHDARDGPDARPPATASAPRSSAR